MATENTVALAGDKFCDCGEVKRAIPVGLECAGELYCPLCDPSTTAIVKKFSPRTFHVLLGNKSRVEAALIALNKRAARKHLPELSWSWGKPVTAKELVPHHEYGWKAECSAQVSRIPLTLIGETPKYAGWSFVAALQHLDGENIVRALPGETLPETYRTRGSACDHCNQVRRRNDTYVCRHDDGRFVQVGSTCVADFLGSDDAGRIAAQCSLLAEARGLAEGGCEGFGNASDDRTIEEYLPFVAYFVREQGWVSRTTARERGEEGRATADQGWFLLTGRDSKTRDECAKVACEITKDDEELAASAASWAESLPDFVVDAEKGDYLHNIRAAARTGLVTRRTAGIIASIVVAYQRHLGREREKAERAARPELDAYLGMIGKRETWSVVLDFVTGYETGYGYTTVLKFRTAEGGCLVWKATNTEISRSDVGKRFTLTGTVKKHDEYKGKKQTILSRCKAVEVKEDSK